MVQAQYYLTGIQARQRPHHQATYGLEQLNGSGAQIIPRKNVVFSMVSCPSLLFGSPFLLLLPASRNSYCLVRPSPPSSLRYVPCVLIAKRFQHLLPRRPTSYCAYPRYHRRSRQQLVSCDKSKLHTENRTPDTNVSRILCSSPLNRQPGRASVRGDTRLLTLLRLQREKAGDGNKQSR